MNTDRRQGPPLTIIGLWPDGGDALSQNAQRALREAELVIGAERHFAILENAGIKGASVINSDAQRLCYPTPFSSLQNILIQHQHRRIALLASGDPLLFGLGGYLRQHFEPEHLVFYPAISSVQMAFAKLGQPWQQAEIVSLHGRSLVSLRAHLQRNRLYALLTDAHSHPAAIAVELVAAGFGESDVWVCEALGHADEQIRRYSADQLAQHATPFSPLNVVVVHTRGQGGTLPEFPGISDDLFSTDSEQAGRGLLTKREVRLTVLSLLQPHAEQTAWDIGAGCGGVAVEWARWNRLGEVHALECHTERLRHLTLNRERFGVVTNLHIHNGRAPESLADLPDPHAIFVGGGGQDLPAILDACWARLPTGGTLVASAVTENARVALHLFAGANTEWIELSVSRGDRLAQQRLMRPQLPVLLMKRVKL